jgi:hypothetical protein
MVVLVLVGDPSQLTPPSPSLPERRALTWTGTYAATVVETTVQVMEVSFARSIQVATRASGGGAASVIIKIYACDTTGTATGASALLTKTLATWTTTTTTLDNISEMGGATTGATYPPTAATGGQIIVPFGNYIKITETPTYTSGTTSLSLELAFKR